MTDRQPQLKLHRARRSEARDADMPSALEHSAVGHRCMIPEPCHDLSPSEIDAIEDRLYAFNSLTTGHDDAASMAFVVRDESDEMIGAIAGHTWAGIAEIKQLWVQRGRGYGRALLNAVISEARVRNVARIWVATYEFQAPLFYEKAGFAVQAELAGWPNGCTNFVLCKTLD